MEKKVAIVTGSSSGIGEAIARRFARDNVAVVLNSVHSVDEGLAVAAELPDALYVRADVSKDRQARSLVSQTLDHFGRLDIVVNNAGTTRVIDHADLEAVSSEDWSTIVDTNVVGPFQVIRAAAPALASTGDGAVVNISSVAGVRPLGSSIPYATSKAALNHLTILLARVLGPEIRVNAVAPGLIDTPWTEDWDEIRAHVRNSVPLRRSGSPADVADAVMGLIDSRYATGQVVVVDGGLQLL